MADYMGHATPKVKSGLKKPLKRTEHSPFVRAGRCISDATVHNKGLTLYLNAIPS